MARRLALRIQYDAPDRKPGSVSLYAGPAGLRIVDALGGDAAHSDHGTQAHTAHAGATVGNHTDVTNHVHVQSVNSASTGSLSGYTADTSTNTSAASGYSTANPTSVGVAAMVHAVGQASAHSDHGTLAHTAHAGGAVVDGSTIPPYFVVYVWKRTA